MNDKKRLTEFQKGIKSALMKRPNIWVIKNGKLEPVKNFSQFIFCTPQADILKNALSGKF